MIRKLFIILLTLVAAVSLDGCAAAKKKFVRKQQERVVKPVVFTEEGYTKEYSNEYYYNRHFTNWRTWHDELLRYWGKNAKRERRSADEIVGHLEGMRNLLKEPKRSELEAIAAQMRDARQQIEQDRRGVTLRSDLDKIRRNVNSNFYYDKVKEHVLTEEVDLGPAQP